MAIAAQYVNSEGQMLSPEQRWQGWHDILRAAPTDRERRERILTELGPDFYNTIYGAEATRAVNVGGGNPAMNPPLTGSNTNLGEFIAGASGLPAFYSDVGLSDDSNAAFNAWRGSQGQAPLRNPVTSPNYQPGPDYYSGEDYRYRYGAPRSAAPQALPTMASASSAPSQAPVPKTVVATPELVSLYNKYMAENPFGDTFGAWAGKRT